MQPKKKEKAKRKPDNQIPVNQCRLYKVTSPKRLAEALNLSVSDLNELLICTKNYRFFDIPLSVNPFTGKTRKKRSVQEPTQKLRRVHNRILSLLRRMSYPDYVQGAVKHRSYQTNAEAHKGSREAATFDISSFYGSTKYHLVHDFFVRVMCCPSDIAGKLANLTTCNGAMSTGSPLSPLLSFWVAKKMFDECHTLAGSYNLKFTCYIDDLTFSGEKIPRILKSKIKIIVSRYGYKLAEHKTRHFKFGQPAHITGIISLNKKLHVPFSRLMAVRKVTNAIEGNGESFGFTKEELKKKLAGMVGEAATIDSRFDKWAMYTRNEIVDPPTS